MFNRRFFIKATSSALAVATLPKAMAITKISHQDDKKALLTKNSVQQEYISKIGDSFLVRSETGTNLLKLENVESGVQQKGIENFRLVFSSKAKGLPENLYSVTHLASFKTQKIYIEPSHSIKNHIVASFCLLT